MKNMTEGNPIKLIVELAIPMLIGNIFQQIYSVVDTIIVGKYLGEEALAGVGSTGSLCNVLLCFVFGLGTGAGLIVAQAFGLGDKRQLQKTISALITTAFCLSVIISIIGAVFCRRLLVFLSVPEGVIDYATSYLKIIFLFVYANVAYNAAGGILRSVGDTKTPLVALIISSILNVVLDILFILMFNMSVEGVAYATIISHAVSAVFCIYKIYGLKDMLGLKNFTLRPEREYVMRIVRTGFPSAFQSCMISLGGVAVQRLINSFGSSVMAGYVAANKIDSVAIQVVIAISTALSIFTGQNMGRGNFERIKKGLYQTLVFMLCCCGVIAIVVPTYRFELICIFLDKETSAEAVAIGSMYLAIIGIAYMIAGVMNTYLNVIKGAGDVNTCMFAGLTELSGRIIFAYLLAHFYGVMGIWIATPISWGCGCIIPVVRYYSGKWKTKKLV